MRVVIPKEISDAERRVALVPALVQTLNQMGLHGIIRAERGYQRAVS